MPFPRPGTARVRIAEMARHPERDLVVAPEGFNECLVLSGSSSTMRRLLQYPFVPAPRHGVETFTPVCGFLHENYHWLYPPSETTYGYGVMRHN